MFEPSRYQLDIFDEIDKAKNNLIVNAVPGSGKTTTILKCVERIPSNQQILAVCFNKSIQVELTAKMPSYVHCKTLNALGLSVLKSHFPQLKVDNNKLNKIMGEFGNTIPYKIIPAVRTMYELARSAGVGIDGPLERKEVRKLLKQFNTEINKGQIAPFVRAINILLKEGANINLGVDFTDMLYMPVKLGLTAKKFDWIFVDEAQDLSKIQLELIHLFVGPQTKLVFVGDRLQSIYAFRGADIKSMDNIAERYSCKEMPLSITYRCPESAVELLKKLNPNIEGRPNNIQGTVSSVTKVDVINPDNLKGSVIVCRNNAPLVLVAVQLRANNFDARILGDMGSDKKILKYIEKTNPYSCYDLIEKAKTDYFGVFAKHKDSRENHWRIEQQLETSKVCIYLAESCRNIEEVKSMIKSIFTKDPGSADIMLMTVHKAKGLEARNVVVVNRMLFEKYGDTKEEIQQEDNIKYVALSRVIENLIFLDLPEKSSVVQELNIMGDSLLDGAEFFRKHGKTKRTSRVGELKDDCSDVKLEEEVYYG